jgi:hypothetical protein
MELETRHKSFDTTFAHELEECRKKLIKWDEETQFVISMTQLELEE